MAKPLSFPQGTQVIKLFNDDLLTQSMKQAFVRAVQAKCKSSEKNHAKDKQKNQTMRHPENYFPVWLWNLVIEPSTSYHQLLMGMEKHIERLGLTNGNEPSYVNLLSSVLLARMGPKCVSLPGSDFKQMSDDLKDMLKARTKKIRLPHYGDVIVYPPFPSDLAGLGKGHIYEIAYPDTLQHPENLPRQCDLDHQLMNHLKARMPCRRTHSSLGLESVARPLRFESVLGAKRRSTDLPGFKLCNTKIMPFDQTLAVMDEQPEYQHSQMAPQIKPSAGMMGPGVPMQSLMDQQCMPGQLGMTAPQGMGPRGMALHPARQGMIAAQDIAPQGRDPRGGAHDLISKLQLNEGMALDIDSMADGISEAIHGQKKVEPEDLVYIYILIYIYIYAHAYQYI